MEQACDEAEAEKLKILKEREEQLQNSAEENAMEVNPQDLVKDILNDVINHVVDVCSVTKSSRNLTREQYANIMQKDCFLVFRSLCKLSMTNSTSCLFTFSSLIKYYIIKIFRYEAIARRLSRPKVS